jgi:hypothetical protein
MPADVADAKAVTHLLEACRRIEVFIDGVSESDFKETTPILGLLAVSNPRRGHAPYRPFASGQKPADTLGINSWNAKPSGS